MGTQPGTALVTGGGSGIGLAVTRALLDRGWSVAICGRDAGKLSLVRADLARSESRRADRLFASPADVSKNEDVRRWTAEACDRLGPPSLPVNNAGVGARSEIVDLPEEQWDRTLDINLKGAFLCTREVLPRMRSLGGGWIVNVASLAGKKGFAGSAAYCASKFGLVGFTQSLAREEAGNGIRATAICPGYVATPMVARADVPAPEMIRPEDVAATVLYLLDLSAQATVLEIVIQRLGAL